MYHRLTTSLIGKLSKLRSDYYNTFVLVLIINNGLFLASRKFISKMFIIVHNDYIYRNLI